VTNLSIGDVLRVSDLPHSDKLKFITDEGTTVAHVVAIKEEVAPAADAAAAPTEPEVAKKGKAETPDAAAEKGGGKK
jgi:large subunit ribosomal protein L25